MHSSFFSVVRSSLLAFQGALGAYVVTTLLYIARSRENSASSVSLAVIRLQKRINCGACAWQQSFVLRVADSWKPGPLQTPLPPSNKKWNLSCFPLNNLGFQALLLPAHQLFFSLWSFLVENCHFSSLLWRLKYCYLCQRVFLILLGPLKDCFHKLIFLWLWLDWAYLESFFCFSSERQKLLKLLQPDHL